MKQFKIPLTNGILELHYEHRSLEKDSELKEPYLVLLNSIPISIYSLIDLCISLHTLNVSNLILKINDIDISIEDLNTIETNYYKLWNRPVNNEDLYENEKTW